MQGILFQVTLLFFLDSCISYKYFQLGNELYAIYERHVYNIKNKPTWLIDTMVSPWQAHLFSLFSVYIDFIPRKNF